MSQHNAQHAVHLAIRTIYVMTLEYKILHSGTSVSAMCLHILGAFTKVRPNARLKKEAWGWGWYNTMHNNVSYGRRAFCVAGPSVWNSLPDNLRNPIIGGNSFRQSLKTFLFATYWCIFPNSWSYLFINIVVLCCSAVHWNAIEMFVLMLYLLSMLCWDDWWCLL